MKHRPTPSTFNELRKLNRRTDWSPIWAVIYSHGIVLNFTSSKTFFPVDYRLVVVGELACLSDLESFTVWGIPPVGPTLAGRSKGKGQTKW